MVQTTCSVPSTRLGGTDRQILSLSPCSARQPSSSLSICAGSKGHPSPYGRAFEPARAVWRAYVVI